MCLTIIIKSSPIKIRQSLYSRFKNFNLYVCIFDLAKQLISIIGLRSKRYYNIYTTKDDWMMEVTPLRKM